MNIVSTLKSKYADTPEIQLNTSLKKNKREDILNYSEQGLNIIPLYKYTKKASLTDWTRKNKITRSDISGRSHPEGNIGLRLDYTYPDGTFLGAIDIESTARKEVLIHFISRLMLDPDTVPWTKTQSDAVHLYFRTEKELKPIMIKDEKTTVVELRMGRTQQNVLGPSIYREIKDNGEYERFKSAHITTPGGFDTADGYEDLFESEERQYETYGSLLDVPLVASELITSAFEELGYTIRFENSSAHTNDFESKEVLTEEQLPKIFQYCKYAEALKIKIAKDKYLDHEERIWLANILKPFGSEVIHSYFQNMEDYDRDYTQRQIESLKHNPSLCPALRGSNSGSDAANVCRNAQCINILAIGKKSPIAFAYQNEEKLKRTIGIHSSCAKSDIVVILDDNEAYRVLSNAGAENIILASDGLSPEEIRSIESCSVRSVILALSGKKLMETVKLIIDSAYIKVFVLDKKHTDPHSTIGDYIRANGTEAFKNLLLNKAISAVKWAASELTAKVDPENDFKRDSALLEAVEFAQMIRSELDLSSFVEIVTGNLKCKASDLNKTIKQKKNEIKNEKIVSEYSARKEKGFHNLKEDHERYFAFIEKSTSSYSYYDRKEDEVYIGVPKEILINILASGNQVFSEVNPVLKAVFNVHEDEKINIKAETFNLFSPTEYMLLNRTDKGVLLDEDCRHINLLLKNLFPKDQERDHFINWLSGVLQTRDKQLTAWVLKGAQGAGKGVLLSHVLKPLFGKKQAIKVENEQLLSQFNAYLQNVMIIAFNEIATSNDERNSIKSKIKAIITDSEIQINEKMIRPYYVENYANCLFYSNEGVPVLIEENDRRFNVVLTGGNISKQDWFQNPDGVFISIRNEMPKFAQYLMNYDYDPQRARTVIQNEEKESLVSAGMNRFEEFAMHLKQNDFTWINENQVPRDNIIDDRKQLKESDVNGKILKDLAHEVFNRIYPSQKVNKITLSKHLKLYGIESARLEGGMLDIRQNYYRWE